MKVVQMSEDRIRRVIDNLIKLFRENTNRWDVKGNIYECYAHYDFFRLLFNEFSADEIKDNFKWELPVGKPEYGKSNKTAFVDLVMYIDNEEFIAIEIESVSQGIALENELKKCVVKLKTTLLCQQFMTKGYIVPLMCRERNKIARGYSMTYSELCERQLNDAQNEIGNSPIELVREGIILVG